MASDKRSQYAIDHLNRYRQGDILRDLRIVEWAEIVQDDLVITERQLPYAVILSQECDLEHDYNNHADDTRFKGLKDKCLPTILVCPAYLATQLRTGEHLQNLGLKMQSLSSDQFKRLKQNNDSRYHYLAEEADLQLPELVVDFKHFFSIPRNVIYRDSVSSGYVCSIDDLFRENLSNRFANYISRIGLPELESAA
jgi:hypothetical protein